MKAGITSHGLMNAAAVTNATLAIVKVMFMASKFLSEFNMFYISP
jgi:hypothetical protein